MPHDSTALTDPEILDLLPTELRYIAETIGVEATLKLVGARGGSRLYVAVRVTPHCATTRLIGMDAAKRLAAMFGGDTIEIPRALNWRLACRDALIFQQSRTMPQMQLALTHNLTTRQIRNVLSRMKARVRRNAAACTEHDELTQTLSGSEHGHQV